MKTGLFFLQPSLIKIYQFQFFSSSEYTSSILAFLRKRFCFSRSNRPPPFLIYIPHCQGQVTAVSAALRKPPAIIQYFFPGSFWNTLKKVLFKETSCYHPIFCLSDFLSICIPIEAVLLINLPS